MPRCNPLLRRHVGSCRAGVMTTTTRLKDWIRGTTEKTWHLSLANRSRLARSTPPSQESIQDDLCAVGCAISLMIRYEDAVSDDLACGLARLYGTSRPLCGERFDAALQQRHETRIGR